MAITVTCPVCDSESILASIPKGLLICKKCKLPYIYKPNNNKRKRQELTFSDSEDNEDDAEDDILPDYKYEPNQFSDDDDEEDDDDSEYDHSKMELDSDLLKSKYTRQQSDESEFQLSDSDSYSDESEHEEEEAVFYKRMKPIEPPPCKQQVDRSNSPIPKAKLPEFKMRQNIFSSDEDEEEIKPKPKPKKRVQQDILFENGIKYDQEEEDEEESRSSKKRFKEIDDIFSDLDEESEDEEVNKSKKKRKRKNPLTRREQVNLFNSLKKVDDDTALFKDSDNAEVRTKYTSGGTYEKVGKLKKAAVPRVKYKRNLRKEENEYVRGPYRFGAKTLNKYNPYIMFNSQHRAEIKKLNPDATNKELTKIVAEAWSNLEPAKKEEYQKLAAKMRQELSEKLDAGKEITNTIKQPPNAYLIFQSENKDKYKADLVSGEIKSLAKVMSAKWKELPEEEKEKYRQESKRQRDEYYEKYPDIHKQKMAKMIDKIQAKRTITMANKKKKTPK